MSMNLANQKTIKILDYAIFSFILLFLASLTNSIFVNQLGYYGALILILVKYSLTKENPFKKTGLEPAILLFILAEFISSLFSINQPQSFHNLLKRVLLLPIIYTISASSENIKKDKFYFNFFIGAAVLTTGYYLFTAYNYFINNLYQIKQTGPDSLQYPITTSEILSFMSVLLFAFLLTGKQKIQYKILQFFLLVITLLALFSTYKRTGWIGTAAGIFVILIINKNWKTVGALIIGGMVLIFSQTNVSELHVYNLTNSGLEKKSVTSTDGRAYSTLLNDSVVFLADFEKGLKKVSADGFETLNIFDSPVTGLEKLNDSIFIASFVDTRFAVLKLDQNKFIKLTEVISPGYTESYKIFYESLYVLDNDSGLTVFNLSTSSIISDSFREIKNFRNIIIDSSYTVFYSPGEINIYRMKNLLPDTLIWEYESEEKINAAVLINNTLMISEGSNIYEYTIAGNNVVEYLKRKNINPVVLFYENEGKLYCVDNQTKFYDVIYDSAKGFEFHKIEEFGFIPTSLKTSNNKIYVTLVKRSRVGSIFDFYMPSNFTRFALWNAGIKIFKDNPIFGVGDIDLAKLYSQYKNYYDKEIHGHMHINYVHILVILGSFGFVVVMFLFYKIFRVLIKIYYETKGVEFVSSFSIGAIGVFVSFLISGLTEWNFGDHEIIKLLWFVVGLNFSFYNHYKEKEN